MWTQTLPSGKVRYFERFQDKTGRSKVFSITLDDERKSTQKIAREELRIKAGKFPDGRKSYISFGELVRRYKAHLRAEYKPQTAEAAEFKFRAILRGIGEDTLVNQLTAPMVRAALMDKAPSKYNERLKHLKAALRWAYTEDLVDDVHFLDRLPKMRSERRREALAGKYLEANELRTLLDGMKVEKWRLLTEFLVLSGLRIGEVIALQQTDVNLTTLQITVNKTYSLITREVSPSAKTEAGNRVISIQDELLDCIHRINGIFPKRRKLFFPDLVYEAYAKYLRENTKALVGKKLSPHALRHTSVALFAAAGVDLSVIARRLGHADSRITRDVYMHVTQRLMERDALQLQKVRVL